MQYETSLNAATLVTFAGGSTEEKAKVLFTGQNDGRWLVVTDRTPFHPVSLFWPDQPADRGTLALPDGTMLPVVDAWSAWVDLEAGALLVDEDARAVRRGSDTHKAIVVHVVESGADMSGLAGSEVELSVDADYRAALNLNHTAVHLAALALNKAAASSWTKDYPDLDSFGVANLDKAAVEASSISDAASVDEYRVGKSLRKKGFDREAFVGRLDAIATEINETVRRWLATPAAVTMTPREGALDGLRIWQVRLDDVEVSIPCGGTHVDHLSQIGEVTVVLAPLDEGFRMTTSARSS